VERSHYFSNHVGQVIAKNDPGYQATGAHDTFGAIVRRGKARLKGEPCGDAILVDPEKHFFAVADAPDRNPGAARLFLQKYCDGFRRLPLNTLGQTTCSHRDVTADVGVIAAYTAATIKSVNFNDNTTFTGLFVVNGPSLSRVLLLHCGDSVCYHIRPSFTRAQKLTRSSHHFVGRCNGIHQADLLEICEDSLLMLATDGLLDVVRSMGGEWTHQLVNFSGRYPLVDMPVRLLERHDLTPDLYDDFGMIVIKPCNVGNVNSPPAIL